MNPVTGWGSFNALQLTRAITTYRAYFWNHDRELQWLHTANRQSVVQHRPKKCNGRFSGTGPSRLSVDRALRDFSQGWDSYIYDSTKEATPWERRQLLQWGPQFPNATYGETFMCPSAGQGCHTAQVSILGTNSGGLGFTRHMDRFCLRHGGSGFHRLA